MKTTSEFIEFMVKSDVLKFGGLRLDGRTSLFYEHRCLCYGEISSIKLGAIHDGFGAILTLSSDRLPKTFFGRHHCHGAQELMAKRLFSSRKRLDHGTNAGITGAELRRRRSSWWKT